MYNSTSSIIYSFQKSIYINKYRHESIQKREKKIYFHISFYDAHDPIVLMPRLLGSGVDDVIRLS